MSLIFLRNPFCRTSRHRCWTRLVSWLSYCILHLQKGAAVPNHEQYSVNPYSLFNNASVFQHEVVNLSKERHLLNGNILGDAYKNFDFETSDAGALALQKTLGQMQQQLTSAWEQFLYKFTDALDSFKNAKGAPLATVWSGKVDPATSKSGTCDNSQTYTLTSPTQLKQLRNEAECIYARGIAPIQPPLGLWYGDVIEILNSSSLAYVNYKGRIHCMKKYSEGSSNDTCVLLLTDLWNTFAQSLWKGKICVKSKCRAHQDFYFLLNLVATEPQYPAYVYLGHLTDKLAPGEYDDGKTHLFVDYVVNFEKICPISELYLSNTNFGTINPWFPMNQLIDLVRIVGKQEDGGILYLGKTFLRSPTEFPEAGDISIAFWSIVNYDEAAVPPQLQQTDTWTLGPLDHSFTYHHGGVGAFLHQFAPLQNIFSHPEKAIVKLNHWLFHLPSGWFPNTSPLSAIQQFQSLGGSPSDSSV